MREPKTTRDLYYWLDAELSIIHIALYIIMGINLGGKWWILFAGLSLISLIHAVKAIIKGGLGDNITNTK